MPGPEDQHNLPPDWLVNITKSTLPTAETNLTEQELVKAMQSLGKIDKEFMEEKIGEYIKGLSPAMKKQVTDFEDTIGPTSAEDTFEDLE